MAHIKKVCAQKTTQKTKTGLHAFLSGCVTCTWTSICIDVCEHKSMHKSLVMIDIALTLSWQCIG